MHSHILWWDKQGFDVHKYVFDNASESIKGTKEVIGAAYSMIW
jgi:hypothetical protein